MRIPKKYVTFEKIIIHYGNSGEKCFNCFFAISLFLGDLELVQYYMRKIVEDPALGSKTRTHQQENHSTMDFCY